MQNHVNNIKIFPVLVLYFICSFATAQTQPTVTFDAGQTFSTYKYTDSAGSITDFTNNITGSYNLGYQHITNSGLFVRTGIGMRKGGASLLYNGIQVDWVTQYADAQLGVGYIYNAWRVKPYISATGYYAIMLKGIQSLGQTQYDILQNKTMSPSDYGVFIMPGVKVALTNSVSIFAEYKHILGLQNLELTSGQKSYNRGYSVNLGVAIAFIKYNYVTTK